MKTLIDIILTALAAIGLDVCFAFGVGIMAAVIDSFGRDDE